MLNLGRQTILFLIIERLQKLKAWEYIDAEAIQWFEEKEKLDNKKNYDMSVANALANANIDMSIKKNTQ